MVATLIDRPGILAQRDVVADLQTRFDVVAGELHAGDLADRDAARR